jgi:hypothetical protein
MINLIITAFLQKLGIGRNYIKGKNTIFNSLPPGKFLVYK